MSIVYRGKNAKTAYNLEILSDLSFENAARDVEIVEIPGRDSDIVLDNGRFKPVTADISFVMWRKSSFTTFESQMNAVKNWLSAAFGYSNMTWYPEPNYIYRARVDGSIKIKPVDKTKAIVDVKFILSPSKYLVDGAASQALSNGGTLNNLGLVNSQPSITLTGTGNVTLTVNDKNYVFKNITGGLIIDSENKVATNLSKSQAQWDKVYTWPLPMLKTGSNVISWDNSAFTVTIVPNWCELV